MAGFLYIKEILYACIVSYLILYSGAVNLKTDITLCVTTQDLRKPASVFKPSPVDSSPVQPLKILFKMLGQYSFHDFS